MDVLQPIIHLQFSTDAEKKNYIEALRNGKHTMLMFYSKSCRLCRSLKTPIEEIKMVEGSWLNVACLCTDEDVKWAPEMLHYDVTTVPSFVMMLPYGNAVMKSGPPINAQRTLQTLRHFVDKCKPR